MKFQSAPLTGARGDVPAAALRSFEVEVSIRSPHRSEGRSGGRRHQYANATVSIRSPHRSEGRYTSSRSSRGAWSICFNPLPSPERGEMLVVVTSQQSESYTGICANRSNGCPSNLIQLSTNGATSCDADACERREITGNTPALGVRTSYKTSGPVKSTGSLTP